MPTNIQEWLAKVNQIQQGGQEPIVPGQRIPGFANPNIQLSPKSSSIDLKQYKDYVGTPVLTGGPDEQLYLDDLRAQNQSALEQAGNSALKFGITAGTTFVDGLAGTAFGVANMFAGDQGFSDFWNNPLSNAMTDIQEWSEKALPNYRTAAELDAPFWKNLGTVNFWGDTVFKNLGFTVGALGAAALSGGVAGEGLLLKQGVKSLAKNSYGKLARTLGTSADDVARQLAEGTLDFSRLSGALAKDAKQLRVLNSVQSTQGALMGAIAEARFEAINGAREYYDTNKQKYIDLGMSEEEADLKASKESLGVGNTIFALNTALLTMSNAQQFKSLLNPGYQVESKAIKGLMLKDGKYAFEGMGKLGKTASLIKNPLMEGAEELSQTGVGEFAKSYYERINDPEATNLVNAFTASLADVKNKILSEEGLESFFVGMFTGAVGMPNIRKAIQDKSIKSAVTGWSGGIAEQARAIKAEEAKGNENVEKLNKILESDDFKNNYMNITASLGAEAAKNRALRKKDEVAYEVANLQGFHSTVQNFIDSGKVNDLYEFLDNQGKKDATTLREEWSVENDKGEMVDPFNHLSDEQVVDYNRKRVESQVKLAKRIAEATNEIETKTANNINPAVKKTLVEALVTTEFAETKAKEYKQKLVDEIVKSTGKKEFDGVPVESVIASAEAIQNMPTEVSEYLEKKYPNTFREWKKFTEVKEAAVILYDSISGNPEKFEKKIEKQQEEVAKQAFEQETTENPKTGNKFDGVMSIRGKIKMKGYDVNEEVPVTLLNEEGEQVGTATIRTVDGEQLVYSSLQDTPAKLSSLVGKNIKITSKEEKLKQEAESKTQKKKDILNRMSEQSKRHFNSVNKKIKDAETELEKLQVDKDKVQEHFEKTKSKRISKKNLKALIETTEAQIKEIDGNIQSLQKELAVLTERSQMIQEYQATIQEEIVNVEEGKEVGEYSKALIDKLREATGLQAFEFGNDEYLKESLQAANEALSTINQEIDLVNSELDNLSREKSELESILSQYKNLLPKFESRDEILDSFKSMYPNSNLSPDKNFIASQFVLGKISKNDLKKDLNDDVLADQLSEFKNTFQKLKDIDLGKFEVNLGELSKAIEQHEQLLDKLLKEKSYLETFKKLQNLELVRKGYEATALSTSADAIISKAEADETKVIAQEESNTTEADYQKDSVGANTYRHIAYDNGFKDVYEEFEFEGNTYNKPKLNDNPYNKAYGEWMSELKNPADYRLQLVTLNSATEEQQMAINGLNPTKQGEDSIYVFVVGKNGNLVKHNDLLLVSAILDSTKNSLGGERFSAEAVKAFLEQNSIKVNVTPEEKLRAADVFTIEINGEKDDIEVAKFATRKDAIEVFNRELMSKMEKEYKRIKKSLYEAVNASPAYRDISSISNGFPLRVKENVEFKPSQVFKKEDLSKVKIRVAKKSSPKSPETYKEGSIVANFEGREIVLKRRRLNNKEVDFLFNTFKFYADKSRDNIMVGSYPLFPPAYAKGENVAKFSAISNLLNFGMNRDSTSKKVNRDKDQIFITKDGNLVIITKTNLDTGEQMDTFQTHDFPFDSIAENENKIKTYLKNKRRNVNDAQLSGNKEAVNFEIDEKGVVTSTPIKKSYQQELLDDVLVTDVIPYTEGPQFAQRYFSFDFNQEITTTNEWDALPVQEVPFEEDISVIEDSGLEAKSEEPTITDVETRKEDLKRKRLIELDKTAFTDIRIPYTLEYPENIISMLSGKLPINADEFKKYIRGGKNYFYIEGRVYRLSVTNNQLVVSDIKGFGVHTRELSYLGNLENKGYTNGQIINLGKQDAIFAITKGDPNSDKDRLQSSLEFARSRGFKEFGRTTEGDNINAKYDAELAALEFQETIADIPELENAATDNDFGFDSIAQEAPVEQIQRLKNLLSQPVEETDSGDFRVQSPGKTLEELINNNIIERQCL